MKPPFIFETHREPPIRNRNKRIMFMKNVYQPIVKVDNWQGVYESLPFDNEVNNSRVSHYTHLGQNPCHCYATTTSDMYRQIELKGNYLNRNPVKKITSYLTFKDTNNCKDANTAIFSEMCASDYITTMQKDYTPPYPALSIPASHDETQFMTYRMLKREDPQNSQHMFWDEGIPEIVGRLQCWKGQMHKSYNFNTGLYTDGSLPHVKKNCCVDYKSLYL